MTTIWLTTGLPASGKSTWARELVKQGNGQIIRVNLDDIRVMLGIDPACSEPIDKELTKTLHVLHDKAILAAVAAGKDVVVDNTHLVPTIPKRIKKLFDGDVRFKVQDFTDVPLYECIFRDHARENSVGESVIKSMAKALNKPWHLTEEFMNDYEYPLIPVDPEELDENGFDKEPVFVFDIDGTLARHHRSPYDYSRLHTDSVYEHIKLLNQTFWYQYYTIFIVSGRPDSCRAETEQWLQDNNIFYHELYMRRADDKRNDADVKHEIFDKYIRPNFWVDNWFDDRDRVVRRLRKLGINVAQVQYGDF